MIKLKCKSCAFDIATYLVDYGYGELEYYCLDCQRGLENSIKIVEYITKLSYQNSKQAELLRKVYSVIEIIEKSTTEKLFHQLKDWKNKNKEWFTKKEI